MAIHELKTWPEPFRAVLAGEKRHEVRIDDRNYRVGDLLHLREWDPAQWGVFAPESNSNGAGKYTGRDLLVLVTYITRGWGLPEGMCVMSIEEAKPTPPATSGRGREGE
jgi:hypothetical protein